MPREYKSDYDYFAGQKIFGTDGKVYGIILDYADMYMSIRKKSIHLFRKHIAWGIDIWVLEELKSREITFIGIIEVEEWKVYVVPVRMAWSRGITEAGQDFIPLYLFDYATCGETDAKK